MIRVSRLNKTEFLVNPDLIEFIEETPDTIVSFQSGRKLVVAETSDELVARIIEFRRLAFPEALIRPHSCE